MPESLFTLEVIGGPMDGLRCSLTGSQVTIGRKVGRTMTLDLDRKVSNMHADAIAEGPNWCLLDLESRNETWVDGKWLEPGHKHPLEVGQVILMASTIIQVFPSQESDGYSVGHNQLGQEEALQAYPMTESLKECLTALNSSMRVRGYFGSAELFEALVNQEAGILERNFDCIKMIGAYDNWKALGTWLISKRLDPLYNIDPNTIIIPPRVWRLLDMASAEKTMEINPCGLLQAMLDEGRSIPARYMAHDSTFMDAFRLIPPRTHVPEPYDIQSAKIEQEGQNSQINTFSNGEPTSMPQTGALDEETRFWREHVQQFEKAILSFIQEALLPGVPMANFCLPPFDERIGEMIKGDTYDKAILRNYINALKIALMDILAAYRGGAQELQNEIEMRIRESLPANYKSTGLWPRDKTRDVADSVLETLKTAKLEALADRIIQNRIRSIFQRRDGN